ncbi:hypothetical protein [Bacillus cereus]|uniref:hypothetical protein n=1 Tax=Bacillus cereus TaxID=1396 RepID=UPI003C2F3074
MRLNKSVRSLPILLAYERDESEILQFGAYIVQHGIFTDKETGIVVLIVKIGGVHL